MDEPGREFICRAWTDCATIRAVKAKRFLEKFVDKFVADDTLTLAASLAFYAALSLAPFLILFVSLSSLLNEDLQRELVDQVSALAGPDAAQAVDIVVRSAKRQTEFSSLAGWVALTTLFISASLIFGQLRHSLNRIFRVHHPHEPNHSWPKAIWCFAKARMTDICIAAFSLVFAVVSVLVSTMTIAKFFNSGGVVPAVINAFVSAGLYLFLFTLLFRFLPTQRVRWARAFQGGAITAILFVIGKELIASYLGRSALGSAYGAAGSLIALLAWVYYSSLIIFVGAQASAMINPVRRKR